MLHHRIMNKFFESLPKPVLALLALAVGIVFIVFTNKPHTICDSQLEILRESQKGGIFQGKGKRATLNPYLPRQMDNCKIGNSPGACYEMFATYRKLMIDLGNVSSECYAPIFEVAEIRKALLEGVELISQLAWGEEPPEYSEARAGWLETSDLALFCKMRGFVEGSVDEVEYQAFIKKVVTKLPGEKKVLQSGVGSAIADQEVKSAIETIGWDEALNRSLFQIRCADYY